MTNQRANGSLSISVSLKLLILALVVVGLMGWLTLAGLTSPLPSTSVSGAGASTLTTPDRGSYARVSDAYGKLPLQFEANAGQTDGSVKFLSRSGGASLFLTSTEAVLVIRQTTAHDDGVPGSAADRHLEDRNGIDLRGGATEVRRESQSPQAAAVTAQDAVVRMKFEGANLSPRVEGAEQLTGYVNYFIGNDPNKWRTEIPTYARVRYEGVYPGVDVSYYGNQRQLEYDLVVAPGANPDVIKLRYDGVKGIRLDGDGNLILITEAGEIRQGKPEVYQCIQGVRKNVETGYARRGKNEVGFKVSRYDRRQPLVIDPILTYSTYLGGNGSDQGLGIAVDSVGSAYVTGFVGSGNFPTVGPIQPAQTGGDAFIAKLNPAGTALVYSTYLGGATLDQGNGIAVDASGNAYVTGRTDSFNFPTVAAIQSTKSGSPFFKSINGGTNWSSSATGLAGANVRDVAINPASPATIYSATEIGVFKSTNSGGNWSATGLFNIFIEAIGIDPVTTTTLYAGGSFGANKSTDAGNTWTAINNGLLVSNSFVPSVNAIVVDPTNTATLYAGTSSGGGVFKSTNGGANWTAANNGLTFVSGTSTLVPTVNGLNFDPTNAATLYASTSSGGVYKSSNGGGTWSAINNGLGTFPTVNALVIDGTNPATIYAGTFNGVFKSIDGGLNWSAVNNGLTNLSINALAIDPTSQLAIYVGTSTGVFTSSNGGGLWNVINNGLTTVNINALAVDKTTPANVYAGANSSSDAFVAKLNSTGSALIYSTYLGGLDFDQGNGIAVDTSNNAYVTGETSSTNFPTANPRQPTNGGFSDAFVTKLNPAGSALLYSTYHGGNGTDQGRGIAVDGSGNAYLTGNTGSSNFPTASAIQPAPGGSNDAFVTKLNSIGSALVYSTYLGGSSSDIGRGISVDGVGQTYVAGETSSINFPLAGPLQSANGGGTDAFVTKLNSVGTGFVYSTYLGGNSTDQAFGIAADAAGNAYVIGQTLSLNFPVKSALQSRLGTDAFVTKFNPPGSALVYSTFLGGNSTDQGRSIAVDGSGNPYVTGITFSTNFPTGNPLQSTNGGSSDAFIAKLGPAADLSVTIGTSPSIPTDGNNLTYTINVLNNGELNATGVVLSDTLPQNATFVSVSTTQGSCTRSGGTVTCNLGSLNNGSAATVTIVVTPTTAGTIVINTASVIGNEPDGNTSNNSRTVNTAINPADLSVALFDSPNSVVGNDLTYTAVVINNGPFAATGVNTLTDTLPSSVTFVSASTGCGISGNTVTCIIGNLASGASAILKIVVRPTTSGTITNTVSVAESGNQADPNTANNTATRATSVNPTDLSVSISDAPDPVNLGSNLTYTIPVANNGPSQAVGVTLTDIVPTNVTFVSASSTLGSCSQASGTVTCGLGNLSSGATGTVTIIVTPTRVDLISNTVNVTASNLVAQAANNTATEVTIVNGATVVIRNLRGFTSNSLPRNDDDSTGLVPLGFTINFFGNSYTGLFVNNNGNVTFDNSLFSFTPFDLTSTQQVIIAPFFADVDTNGSGSSVVTYGNDIVNGRQAFGVNYINVGYYFTRTDKLNSFQLVLIDRSDLAPGNFDIEFNYNKIQWETGEASGGVGGLGGSSARVGYSNGTRSAGTFFELTGSAINGAFLDSNGSTGLINNKINSNQLGRYVLEVRGGNVTTGDLAATLTDSPDPVSVGSNLTYTATVSNNSSSQATGVTLTDTLPSSLTLVSANSTQGACTQSGGTVTCNIGNMAVSGNAGATVAVTIVAVPTVAGTTITNTVNVSGNETDTNPSNNSAPATTTVNPSISGRVTDNSSNGISGVTMSLTGSSAGTTSTDANGNYSFTSVTSGGSYTVTPSKTGLNFTPPSQTFNSVTTNQTANFTGAPIVAISGRVTDGSNNGISGVVVTLSGTLTRVVQTDANGNYAFNDLVGGGNYSVVTSSPLFVFNPPRFDFTNLTANQTANFVQVPNAVPSPTPPLSDDFNGAQRDPQKWNLGTATQPPGAFDPQVTVAQTSGQLVITPRANVSGPHYSGYVSVDSFDMRNGSASVELVQAATGGADTIFAVGTDADNFFRFLVHTPGAPTSLAPMIKGEDGIERLLPTTTAELIFQVKIGGQFHPDPPSSIPYDPVQHRFLRFRNEPATNAIVFETSPNVDFSPTSFQQSVPLQKGVSALTAELSAGTSSPTNPGQTIFDNFKLVTSTFQFSAGSYTVGEGDGSVVITVTRAGSTGSAATVDYTTADGTASQRNKYIPAIGTLRFGVGETIKSFQVLIEDNFLVEGNQTVNLLLGNSVGSGLNSPGRAVLTIVDNDTMPPTVNPLDGATFFARQHYLDFLNRQPDPDGLAFWAHEISLCGTDQACIEVKHINVSAAFFLSIEFQQTGYLVERIYKTAYGDATGTSTFNGAHQLPVPIIRLIEFLPDTQEIGQGVVVNVGNWQQQLEDNKNAFTAEFVQRTRFTTGFATTLTPAQYVDKLFQNAGVTPSASDRTTAINEFSGAADTSNLTARAKALRDVAENVTLTTNEFNRAFVLMQYFGYLRRNPNDPQDTDYTGYDFWLTKLNNFTQPGDVALVRVQNADMVKAFIVSGEYRSRFGP